MQTRTRYLAPLLAFLLVAGVGAGAIAIGIPKLDTGPVKPPASVYVNSATFVPSLTDGTYAYVTGSLVDLAGVLNGQVNYACTATTANQDIKLQGSIDQVTWTDLTALDTAGADQSGTRVAVSAAATGALIIDGLGKTAKSAANRTWRWLRVVDRRQADGGAFGSLQCIGLAK